MARLGRRFSRYFSLSRRPRSSTSEPKIHKSNISKPIVAGQEDTHYLMNSAHTHTHSHSSSVYTISDEELRELEDQKLGRRREDDIDEIIAQYQYTPPTATADPFGAAQVPSVASVASGVVGSTVPYAASASPAPSSTYSSPPSSPPTIMKAKLERFRDTPPPAPGWGKVSFGRETRLFGPDQFSSIGSGGVLREEGRAGRRKDWRGEFGRRGYDVL